MKRATGGKGGIPLGIDASGGRAGGGMLYRWVYRIHPTLFSEEQLIAPGKLLRDVCHYQNDDTNPLYHLFDYLTELLDP